MKRGAALCFAAALTAIGAQPVGAAKNDCAVLSALVVEKTSEAKKVSLGWSKDGVVLRHRGKAMKMPAFEDCELGGNGTAIELDCYWRFSGQDEALARYDVLSNAVAPCMPRGLTRLEGRTAETLKYHRIEVAQIEHSDGDEVEVRIDMIEFFGDEPGDSSRYWVSFEVERDRY